MTLSACRNGIFSPISVGDDVVNICRKRMALAWDCVGAIGNGVSLGFKQRPSSRGNIDLRSIWARARRLGEPVYWRRPEPRARA